MLTIHPRRARRWRVAWRRPFRDRLARRGHEPDRGSALALVPAGFLVLIILGALAVDSAATYQAQEQLADAVTAAAHDAAGAALSNPAFYLGGHVTIDATEAAREVCDAVAAQGDRDLHAVRLSIAVDGPTIRVHGAAVTDAIFGRALPGMAQRHVQADATATAAQQAAGPPPPLGDLTPINC